MQGLTIEQLTEDRADLIDHLNHLNEKALETKGAIRLLDKQIELLTAQQAEESDGDKKPEKEKKD